MTGSWQVLRSRYYPRSWVTLRSTSAVAATVARGSIFLLIFRRRHKQIADHCRAAMSAGQKA